MCPPLRVRGWKLQSRRSSRSFTGVLKHDVVVLFDVLVVSISCGWLFAAAAAAAAAGRCSGSGDRPRDGHDAQFNAVGIRREHVDASTSHVADGRRRGAARRLADRREHAAGRRLGGPH